MTEPYRLQRARSGAFDDSNLVPAEVQSREGEKTVLRNVARLRRDLLKMINDMLHLVYVFEIEICSVIHRFLKQR